MVVLQKIIDIYVKFRSNAKQFNQVMRMPMGAFKKLNDGYGELNQGMVKNASAVQKSTLRFRQLTHGMRGFRMEMLGVMFFGMGLQKFFMGLLKPALELTGIFEYWGTVLKVFFLPTALWLLDVLSPIFDWMIALPDPVKEVVGAFVLFGVAIGSLLFLVGMFTLGIGSLAIGWTFLTATILPIVGIVVGVMAVIALAIILWKDWENISLKVKIVIAAVGVAILALGIGIGVPFLTAIGGAVLAIVGIIAIIKNWKNITETFRNVWRNIFNALPGPVQKAIEIIKIPIMWLIEKIEWLLENLRKFGTSLGFDFGSAAPTADVQATTSVGSALGPADVLAITDAVSNGIVRGFDDKFTAGGPYPTPPTQEDLANAVGRNAVR